MNFVSLYSKDEIKYRNVKVKVLHVNLRVK